MHIFERFYDNFESTINWRGTNSEAKGLYGETRQVTGRDGALGTDSTPTKLLELGEYVHDKFLDLFNYEFNKITEVLVAKRRARVAMKEESENVAKMLAQGGRAKSPSGVKARNTIKGGAGPDSLSVARSGAHKELSASD